MPGQADFRLAVLDPEAPVPPGLSDGAGRPAGRRFAVYRNNVAVSLTEALIDGFPACHAVMGDQMFRAMAGVFLRAHPPQSPVMTQFGASLPAFMDSAPQLSKMRWIGDLARLEFALRDSYHAADMDPEAHAAMAALDPETLFETRFRLAPSLRLLHSSWPVLAIWRRALDPAAPQAQPGAEDVVILRPAYDPAPHRLAPGDATLLSALRSGQTLVEAATAASEHAPDHDLTAILTLLLNAGALAPMPKAR